MSNYLILDTEPNGFCENPYEPFTNLDNWASVRQIAWLTFTEDAILINSYNYFIIDEISKREALKQLMNDLLELNPIIVGHNIEFDANIIGAEFLRIGYFNHLLNYELICTMNSTITYVSEDFSFKYPRLEELYYKIFNKHFKGAHDAFNDAKATSECFFYLKEKGFIFKSFRKSISNYQEYEQRIFAQRNDFTTNLNRAFALQELLRLFRVKKKVSSIVEEINFYVKNYFNYGNTYEEVIKTNAETDLLNLTDLQKGFYLSNEKTLLDRFGIKKMESSQNDSNSGNEIPIGVDLFLFCSMRRINHKTEELKIIAKEFATYLIYYELNYYAYKRINNLK